MLSIYPTSFSPQIIRNSTPPAKQECNYQNNSTAINKTLLALAVLGLATLSSCSEDNDLNDYAKLTDIQKTLPTKMVKNKNSNTYEKADEILRYLGILKTDEDSVKNIKTINSKDNNGIQHWIQPTTILENNIFGKGMKIHVDDSLIEKYNFMIKNAEDNSIDYIKTYENGDTKILNYKITDDNKLLESEVLENNFKLERSVYEKMEDGKIEQTFNDGTKVIYDRFESNNPYPEPITFGAEVSDYKNITNEF